eukprot:GFUD01006317.1.p1 GENE.GFUD01006317.1~~GFUD01006317.1.p1  ORF type:complete len:3795 (+),score=856.15 GFUD01006317.1:678-11387(+)
MAGDPNCVGPNGSVNPNANIDLGALYQQTVENRVTRTFSQHWIIVGKHLRVLLLDFDAKFTLLIPNIELGKAFRINKADVEVQTKELEGGHKLTFMKFIFQSPALEIKAPVLNDKTVGYQVLQQNGACVFLSRIFNIPTLPQNQTEPQQPLPPQPLPPSPQRFQNTNPRSQHPAPHPMAPGYRGPPSGPVHQPVRYPNPAATGNVHLGQGPSHLANAMLQHAGRRAAPSGPMCRSQYPEAHVQPSIPSSVNSAHPLQSPINPLPPPMPIQHASPPGQQNSASKSNYPSHISPPSSGIPSLPPISALKAPYQPQEIHAKKNSYQVSQTERKPMQNFFELYAALNNEEYAKMTTCSFCQRKFRFTSVLLDHLQTHTVNVENIVEMKLKIWVNGRKLKCSETGCKKKYAYTLEYTKHRDSHHYEGLNCAVCGSKQLGPADYASHIKREHQEHLFAVETHSEDIPLPPSQASEQVSIPSPLSVPISEAQSPMFNQPIHNPTTPSSELQVHTPMSAELQVHTPMSAQPIMMASPQTQCQPLSPQQPMSAPPTTQFSDDIDFTSAINMPIIEDEALNPPVPDVINKDNEELMNILKDLKDCTQDYNPPEPSPSAPQSNAQIMADFEMQQDNQKFSFQHDIKSEEPQHFQSPDPHPIILSQRFSTEVNSPAVNSPAHYDNAGQSPQVTDKIPVTNEDKNLQSQSLSDHEMNPNSYHIEETNSPSQSRSPGVIRRVSDVTDPTNQCYMNMSSPATQIHSPINQNHVPSASPHQNMMAYTSPANQPSPLATHSFPYDVSPMINQQNLQQQISRNRHNSFSYSQNCAENSLNSSCGEYQNADLAYTHSSQSYAGTPPQNNKLYQEYPQNHEYSGSGSHPSHAVRTFIANKILGRKSRSSSFDSNKSEPRSAAESLANFTPQGPLTPQGTKCTETKPLPSVITNRHVSESELDKQMYQTSDIPKTSSDSFDFIQTSSEDSGLLPTTIDEINAPAQFNNIQSTQPSNPVQPAHKAQPVVKPELDTKDLPTCDNCGQSFRTKAAISNHVKYCIVNKTGMCSTGLQASGELSTEMTCHKSDKCEMELACAKPQVPVVGLPNHTEKLKENNKEIIDDGNNETNLINDETNVYKCDECADEFMSENNMRIHAAQCGKAKSIQSIQPELPDIEKSMGGEENEIVQQDDGVSGDGDDNSEEKDFASTVTPIKSWLRKHMDSVKIPDHIEIKNSPEQKPLYIIPQEPEERTCDGYSSGTSSSEDEDSPKKPKKSPKRRGRPSKNEKVLDKTNYDTKLSTDPVGGIKIKFSKNNIDGEVTKTEDPEIANQESLKQKEKRPRGRPKGSKNRPKEERLRIVGSKTPKKSKKLSHISLIPQAPNKIVPTKNTTPSPPNSNSSKTSPNSGLSFGLAPLGPALEEIARPCSSSPKRLSESSGSSSDSESNSSSGSEHSRVGSVSPARSITKSPDIVIVDTIVNKPEIIKTTPRTSFEEEFESRQDDFGPILEVASPKEKSPDIADIAVDYNESESETRSNLSPKTRSSEPSLSPMDEAMHQKSSQSSDMPRRDSNEVNYLDNEYLEERCSRSPSPLSTSVDGGNCMSPSRREQKSFVSEPNRSCSPEDMSEDTSILLTSNTASSKPERSASSCSRSDTPNNIPDLPKDETMRSRSSSRSSERSHTKQRSRSRSYQSPVPSRSSSSKGNCTPSIHLSPLRSRSPSRSMSSRSPSLSPNRTTSRAQSSSSSSSSSSSNSESSSDESRSSSPEAPKSPQQAPVQQLPIPKLRIKKSLIPGLTPSSYKPVKLITNPQNAEFRPSANCLANKLRSLNCKVNVPRLKFQVLDQASDSQNGVKIHEKDIEDLSYHQKSPVTKVKEIPKSDISIKDIMKRPPIAPIKIRLRTSSETVSNTGRSLSSILAEIVKEPCAIPPSRVKDFAEFEIPSEECPTEEGFLFSSSLTKSMSALAKFVETEICRDILNDVVIKVEESRKVSGDIIHEILEDIFFNEACCANILDIIVDSVVENVETKKEQVENDRRADIMAQRKYMEQQKIKRSAQELKKKTVQSKAVESINMHILHENVKGINNFEKDLVELPLEVQINETSEQEPDIEVLKSTFEVYVSDDSSIELSDSEFDLDGENPSIIEELKFHNPEDCEQSPVINVADPVNTPVNDEIQSDIVESNPVEILNLRERSISDETKDKSIAVPCVKEFAHKQITEDKESNSSETKNYSVVNVPASQAKRRANLSKNTENRKVPKLVIKPIKKDDIATSEENVLEICSILLSELVNTCVKTVDCEMEELKMPPIIVKIPKASISPKKSSKKDNVKSPKTCIKKLNFSFSKQPSVTIKNLKILPPVPPPVTEAILELANVDEAKLNSITKHDKEKKTISKNSRSKQISPKLQLQTPPPLCVIRNKKKMKTSEIACVPLTVNNKDDAKESIVTVLKMSEIVSMKQKEDHLDRLNDLEKMLELENKLKVEDRRRMKVEREQTEANKKKTSKVSPKSKTVSTKESKTSKDSKIVENIQEAKETKIDLVQNLKNNTKIEIARKNNVTDEQCGQKLVILAKKSPPKPKSQKNGIIPIIPISTKAQGIPIPHLDSDNKSEIPEKVGLQRRNSIPKHKEQWVVSDRIKTPSPTPPSVPTSFVAKKSRPDETVSFSLPVGGFNPNSIIQSKPKPLLVQVDELFSQYFPEAREDLKTFNETPVEESIDTHNENPLPFEQRNKLAKDILDELLLSVVQKSMQENLGECSLHRDERQKELEHCEAKPQGKGLTSRSGSRDISPNSPVRSRNVSAESSRSGHSFNSNESLEDYQNGDSPSEKEFSSRQKKRKSDNLGLNGGYWDVIGVRGVVRERLEKQESIEKEEKTQLTKEKKIKRKEIKKVTNKDARMNTEGLTENKESNVFPLSRKNEAQMRMDDVCKKTEPLKGFISNTQKDNITFVQSIINDIIRSLKTNEDTECPPKQISIKRSAPTENKPRKRQKIQVTEHYDQKNDPYEIQDVFPTAQLHYSTVSCDNGLKNKEDSESLSCEKETKIKENLTNAVNIEKSDGKCFEVVSKKKVYHSKSNEMEVGMRLTKTGGKSVEPSKKKENILRIPPKTISVEKEKRKEDKSVEPSKKNGNISRIPSKTISDEKEKVKEDIYEFDDEDVIEGNKSTQKKHLSKCSRTTEIDDNTEMKAKDKEIHKPLVKEIEDEMDMQDNIMEETEESNNDIWSSINETLNDLKESTNNKEIPKKSKREKSSLTKEKVQPIDDCKDSLLDDLNSSQNSELDGWPMGYDLKDEITGDNIDIWASTNEIMRSISESLSDVKTAKPATIPSCLKNKKESKSSVDSSGSRKSRQKRKDSAENVGNPDSGKENADIENVDLIKSESKKSERVLSPVTKRRKIVNRKYINEDFDDSHSPNRQKETKVIKDSKQTESGNHSKRRRSTSSSTDEGSENEAKKTLIDSEKSTKLIKSPLYKPSPSRKTIKIIDPSPTDPEALKEKSFKSKTSKSKSLKESSPLPWKGEKSKSDMSPKAKNIDEKNTKKSMNYTSKSVTNSSISKPKSLWSSKSSSTKSKTKPSTDLVNYLDKEYDKVKKEEDFKIKYSKK